jgi:uncharacterized protein (DUF2062 family)
MNPAAEEVKENAAHHSLIYRKIVLPLLGLLRMGATPERLAWSLAVGVAAGINPLLGSTTIVCFALVFLFRLNPVAGQISNHLMYPVQLALLFPFFRAGEWLFHTGPLPILNKQIFVMARSAPVQTTKLLWEWEWHAMVAWAMVAVVLTPVLALILTPVLRHTMAYRARRNAA